MKKIVAMIPARLGSKRIPKKNIRLLNNKPLVQYCLEASVKADCFDEIYLNSESEELSSIAEKCGIKFYKRPEHLSSDDSTNDHFALDFLENIDADVLIQILPTSPFITSEEINLFTKDMVDNNYDTLISVCDNQIECLYNNEPINFDKTNITPRSQDLEPVKSYACSLMAWTKDSYVENYKKYDAAYHGANGKTGTFTIKGYSTVDIDNEEDFQLAETIARHIKLGNKYPVKYLDDGEVFDSDRLRILIEDGVDNNTMYEYNKEITKTNEIISNNPDDKCWSHTVINTKSNAATLIAQMPGEGNRMHYHSDWDEWWYIVKGEWDWWVEGRTLKIKQGDVVLIERDKKHKITASGEGQSIRLAVSREDVEHIYIGDGQV